MSVSSPLRKTLSDIVTSQYAKSEVVAHLLSYAAGYVATMGMEHHHVNNELNATMSFLAKSGVFVAAKLWYHTDERSQMLRSNLIGTAVSAPQLLLHWTSLKFDFLTESTRFPVSYGLGAFGTLIRYYMDHRAGSIPSGRLGRI
jgi:hypothetical protein